MSSSWAAIAAGMLLLLQLSARPQKGAGGPLVPGGGAGDKTLCVCVCAKWVFAPIVVVAAITR